MIWSRIISIIFSLFKIFTMRRKKSRRKDWALTSLWKLCKRLSILSIDFDFFAMRKTSIVWIWLFFVNKYVVKFLFKNFEIFVLNNICKVKQYELSMFVFLKQTSLNINFYWNLTFIKIINTRIFHFDTRISYSNTRIFHYDMRISFVLILWSYQLFCTWCWNIREIYNENFDFDRNFSLVELNAIISNSTMICIVIHEQFISIKRFAINRKILNLNRYVSKSSNFDRSNLKMKLHVKNKQTNRSKQTEDK